MAGDSNIVFWLRQRGLPTDAELVAAIRNHAKSTSRVLAEEEVLAVVQGWRA
jgi:2-isopropylmalate synthase